MCITVFDWHAHPLYSLVLLFNRDEYYNRSSQAVSWWEGRNILGGRDELGGGTWLACTRQGRLAFLTNVLEPVTLTQAKTRGDLTLRFLESRKSPREFAEEVLTEADQYNGFNLVLSDLCSNTMVYVSNRPNTVEDISPGIHVLANANLDSSCHKVQLLSRNFRDQLEKYQKSEITVKLMAEELMSDTTKAGMASLPGVMSPEWEYNSSPIYVDFDTPLGRCGTRSTIAVCVKTTGELSVYENYLAEDGWKDHTVSFEIQKMK